MLNKEFKRKDVERMRNLIKGDTGKSAELQVGYTAKKEDYKEGDIWEEGGKQWTIKDGIKQTYTKLDKVKKEAILPLFCPNCGSLMKKRLDAKMYKIHKTCFDCVVKMETQLKHFLWILYILASFLCFIKEPQLGQNKGTITSFLTLSSLV